MKICPKAEECPIAGNCDHAKPHAHLHNCEARCDRRLEFPQCIEHKDDSAISDKAYRHLHVLLFSTVTGVKNDPQKAVDINALADTIVGIVKKG